MTSYNYVVVGAGTAGVVLAARLSENPAVSVLLLEAGPAAPKDTESMRTPWAFPKLFGSEVDWAYVTESQPPTNNRPHAWARGKVLGGSSAINAMAHLRGHPSNYDGWAAGGASEWSYSDLLPYFKKSETTHGRDPELRGTDGPIQVVSDPGAPPEDSPLVAGVQQAGFEFSNDISGSKPEGAFWFDRTMTGGLRQTAADAYLGPAFGRPNLTVQVNAFARKVLFNGKTAVGVEYERHGTTYVVTAVDEVVLAAGAVGTPQLLLLSGVGAAERMRPLGISVVADVPGVGENLQDHYQSYVLYRGMTPMRLSPNGVGYGSALLRTPLATAAPDVQIILWGRPSITPPDDGNGDYYTLSVALLSPFSRGRISLASNDPHIPPRIEPNYLDDDRDVAVLSAGIEIARKIGETPAFARWGGVEMLPGREASAKEITHYLRDVGSTYYHPVGTARIGTDAGAVVDPQLNVRGVRRLRVVDASVMPTVTTANTNATVLAVAERAADLLKATRAAEA